MKTLYLVRHAKSSWEYDVSDRERPLKKRGLNDAEAMALAISDRIPKPDLMLTSPANRAHTTALFFKEAFDLPDEHFDIIDDLYDFGGNDVLKVIRNCDSKVNSLMVFGHNHAFTNLSNKLGNNTLDNLPTCGFVMIQANIDNWKDFTSGETKFTLFPKEIR